MFSQRFPGGTIFSLKNRFASTSITRDYRPKKISNFAFIAIVKNISFVTANNLPIWLYIYLSMRKVKNFCIIRFEEANTKVIFENNKILIEETKWTEKNKTLFAYPIS